MRGRLVTVRERASSFVLLFLCALEREGAWPSAAWLAPALPRCGAGTLAASGGAYQDLRSHGRFGKKQAILFWSPPPPTAPEFCFVLGEGSQFLILLGNRSSFYIG